MTTTVTYSTAGSTITLFIDLLDEKAGHTDLAATVDWGDGNKTTIPRQAKISDLVSITLQHSYSTAGFYVIKVEGRNFGVPTPDTDSCFVYLTLKAPVIQEINRGFIRGPVLPGTTTNSWALGSDLVLLSSNVRQILLTRKGERLMQPEFGTVLDQFIFEMNDDILLPVVQSEVTQAIKLWEPRVEVSSVSLSRDGTVLNVFCTIVAQDKTLTIGVTF